jgi:uncharacterized protein YfiM (DUF2279 family)
MQIKNKTPALLLSLMLLCTPASANGLGNDKAAHITASAAAGIVLAQNKPFNKWKPWQRVLFNIAVIGGGKEWYDSRHPDRHSADWGDIAADAAGAFGAEGMMWIVHKSF